MAKFSVTLAGLSLLVASKANRIAEVGMINPSREHLLPSDKRFASDHLPLLVARRADLADPPVEGQIVQYPLELGARAHWFDKPEDNDLSKFIGWSLQGADVRFPDVSKLPPTPDGTASFCGTLEFEDAPAVRDVSGCNPSIQINAQDPAGAANDDIEAQRRKWLSLQWIASFNQIASVCELAPEWSASPHIAARILLRSGKLSGDRPVEANGGRIGIKFQNQGSHQVFSDAMRYDVVTDDPSVVVTTSTRRARIRFKPGAEDTPIRLWIVSLDDEIEGHQHGLMDHFVLYSLLPWRFRVPEFRTCEGARFTDGGCIFASFFN